MNSGAQSPLLKIEVLLTTADEIVSKEILRFPALQRVQHMLSEALQCITTERLRLKYARGGSGNSH
jgi:hypothetical protein